jgi:3-carboxy-cis,cis-muconate cycloisomerase
VLLRRTAITTPQLAATLHTAAALHNDERADGAWHAEWDTLRILGRRTVVAASHASDLLAGLRVDTDRMAANLAATDVSGEQREMASLLKKPSQPISVSATESYLGVSDRIVDAAVTRAEASLGAPK